MLYISESYVEDMCHRNMKLAMHESTFMGSIPTRVILLYFNSLCQTIILCKHIVVYFIMVFH